MSSIENPAGQPEFPVGIFIPFVRSMRDLVRTHAIGEELVRTFDEHTGADQGWKRRDSFVDAIPGLLDAWEGINNPLGEFIADRADAERLRIYALVEQLNVVVKELSELPPKARASERGHIILRIQGTYNELLGILDPEDAVTSAIMRQDRQGVDG